MENFFEGDAPFFKLFYGDSVYRIREKKRYAPVSASSGTGVAEAAGTYLLISQEFYSITSRTLLLFSYPEGDEIPAGDKALLDSVLGAVKLDFKGVARLNTSLLPTEANWGHIAAQSGADFVIAFGVEEKFLPEGIHEGEIYNIQGKRALCTSSLAELRASGPKKKQLWQGLKEIYGI